MSEDETTDDIFADRLNALEALTPHDQLPVFEEILTELSAGLDQKGQE